MSFTDQFENFGSRRPSEVAHMLREWADEHENENYHEYVAPLHALADRVDKITEPIQFFVMRSPDLFGSALAEFYIDPRRST